MLAPNDFLTGWKAYRAGQPLDLGNGREWKAGWRQAQIKYRGSDKAQPQDREPGPCSL